MLDYAEVEQIEERLNEQPAVRDFLGTVQREVVNLEPQPGDDKMRTGLELATIWTLVLVSLVVLRRVGLIGGKKAIDEAEAVNKLAEAVEKLVQAGYPKKQAVLITKQLYNRVRPRAEDEKFLAALLAVTDKK